MSDNWDSTDACWEPKQKEQKTIYSQSFSRGGGSSRGGPRNFRDRNDRPNRRDDQDGYGTQSSDRGGRPNYGRNNFDRGANQRNRFPRDEHDHRDNFDNSSTEQGSGCSKTIHVNTACIGKIIGKGGSNVKNMQQETGARINVRAHSYIALI